MTRTKQVPTEKPAQKQARVWTTQKALILSMACLAVGIGGGWLIRGWQSPAVAETAKASSMPAASASVPAPAPQTPSPERLKEMADAQAAPLLDKLKGDPKNPEVLISVGNLYYDAQQYPRAIDYYGRALKVRPADANVLTDMGTAYWYTGNSDAAITAFNAALKAVPDNPNTLFNRGLVRWKGKSDAAGAIADWEKLLAVNPGYAGNSQVQQLLAEARAASGGKLSTPAK